MCVCMYVCINVASMSHLSLHVFVHTLFCHFSEDLDKSKEEIKALKDELESMEQMLGDL